MDVRTSLHVLSMLCDALTTPLTLDEGLRRIAAITGELMETGQTVVLLCDEERHELIVRTREGIAEDGVRVGHPLEVPDRLKRILWRVRHIHQIGSLTTGIEGIGFPILVVPLRVKGERVGLLITGKVRGTEHSFDEVKRRLFVLIGSFASLVIENAKVYDYLRQQFAQRSRELIEANRREAESSDETHQLMITSLKDPSKVARLLAVSFYKELARAGFAPDHMAAAASEILACINRRETA